MAEEECMMLQHSHLQTKGGSSAANLFEATRGGLLFWELGIVYGDFV